jgi:transcription antitermination factor NusB
MRHKAREIALQGLYQLEIHKTTELDLIDAFLIRTRQDEWEHFRSRFKEDSAATEKMDAKHREFGKKLGETFEFARNLIQGTSLHRKKLDRVIKHSLESWKLGRLSVLTRNVLRLAVYEMLFQANEVPHRVVINEALELTDSFIDEKTKNFVNSVLQKVYDRQRLPQADSIQALPTETTTETTLESAEPNS